MEREKEHRKKEHHIHSLSHNHRNAAGDPAGAVASNPLPPPHLTPPPHIVKGTTPASKMSGYNSSSSKQQHAKARDLKHRVLTSLHRLSDRDTHSAAASELETLAATISAAALPPFISAVSAADSSDKSPVRRHCVRLVAVLSDHHGDSLSPHLSRLASSVVRRLRDPDSAVRSACVAAALSLSSNLTLPPFVSIAKPFLEPLFTEQDPNAQSAAALCLAAVVEGSRSPDAGNLRRLLPRLEKLAKSESFKAKAAVLGLIGSVVGVKGVLGGGGRNVVRNVVMCSVGFLSSDDWAARKAAAETLMKIAAVEKEALSEYKVSCLKTFEAKRFDKVKATRETMNQMIEAWKEIPDLPEEVSAQPESETSSKENASDGRYPPASKFSCLIGSNTPQLRKRNILDTPTTKTPFSDVSTARKRSPLSGNENKVCPAMFRKLDPKKPSVLKVEIVAPKGSMVSDDSPSNKDEQVSTTIEGERKQFDKPEIKRALFEKNNGKQNTGLRKGGSRVVPCADVSVAVSHETGDIHRNLTESEDLSLIRKQLLQIENQQSNLLDLLQRFIGSSQNGMHSLEARVHGLELALDEISFDLAVSTGKISRNAAPMCCKIPGKEFLSSKLWRKAAARPSASLLFASTRTPSAAAIRSITYKIGNSEVYPFENRRYSLQGGSGLIMNPLAKLSSGSLGFSGVSSSGVVNNIAV